MPRTPHIPSYRLQKSRNLAVVTIDGHAYYLGPYGSDESYERYNALIAEWLKRPSPPNRLTASPCLQSSLTIAELALKYLNHCEAYYVKDGKTTTQVYNEKYALRVLVSLYEAELAADFGPLKLKTLRDHLIEQDKSRVFINEVAASIKRAFKWAAGEELVPASVFHGLQVVAGLKRGRCTARETQGKVLPVDEAIVDATVKSLSPTVAAMVMLQRYTGMRPAEVCFVRSCDVELNDDGTAVFVPQEHKAQHHGKVRRVYIGPRALEILQPFLDRDPEAFCFDPRESVAWHYAQKRMKRKTPLYKSHLKHMEKKRKQKPKWEPLEKYTTASYRRAIDRAVQQAFPLPNGSTDEQVKAWWKKHGWAPNQLRHLRATEIRKQFGIEASQVIMGHSNLTVTQVYAERDFAKAQQIAKLIG
ncbi:MAG: site-specific integrase [Planctomycetaceae bacterium]